VAAVVALAVGLTPALAGDASAAPLGSGESPHTTFSGRLCRYADVPQGYGMRNTAGDKRVYQLGYRETDDEGRRQGILYVYENDAGWLKQQNAGWHMGPLLGEVTVGCGTD
jgi:hypothetical protein